MSLSRERAEKLQREGAYGAIAYEGAPHAVNRGVSAIAAHIKGKIRERQNVRSAYNEARNEAELRYAKEQAVRDAREHHLPSRGSSLSERLMSVTGPGGGGGRRHEENLAQRMEKALGMGAEFGSPHKGDMMGGMGSFEKKAMAALEGRGYREPSQRKHKRSPTTIRVGGKTYYRG